MVRIKSQVLRTLQWEGLHKGTKPRGRRGWVSLRDLSAIVVTWGSHQWVSSSQNWLTCYVCSLFTLYLLISIFTFDYWWCWLCSSGWVGNTHTHTRTHAHDLNGTCCNLLWKTKPKITKHKTLFQGTLVSQIKTKALPKTKTLILLKESQLGIGVSNMPIK